MTPALDVFVIHWNAPDRAVAAARSIRASRSISVRVTVLDNASSPADRRRLREGLPDGVAVVPIDRNLGFAGAANVAVALAAEGNGRAPQWFALAAHDIEVDRDALRVLLDAAAASPAHGVLGPVFWDDGWMRPVSTGGRWKLRSGASHLTELPAESESVVDRDWLGGALLMIRIECVRSIGGFDERLFAYCEDVDLCLRARDAGWGVGVVPAAVAREAGWSIRQALHSYLITRNSLLLSGWRGGTAVLAQRAARAYWHSLRAAVGSILPWRPPGHRAVSRQYARGQFHGATDAVLNRTGRGWAAKDSP